MPEDLASSRALSSVVKLLDHYLTEKQKLVVSTLHSFDGKGRTFTSLVSQVSGNCSVSEPTTRRTLQLMRRTGIIEKRGRYVKLSGMGEEVSRALATSRADQVQPAPAENFK